MKKINIRKFSRNMYSYVDEVPFDVINKRTGKIVFRVIKPKGGDTNEI